MSRKWCLGMAYPTGKELCSGKDVYTFGKGSPSFASPDTAGSFEPSTDLATAGQRWTNWCLKGENGVWCLWGPGF